MRPPAGLRSRHDAGPIRAAILDLDGVVTRTAALHEAAWKDAFDALLARHGDPRPFSHDDYRTYVDGRPRYDGAAAFLGSRGIVLPHGEPTAEPGYGSVAAVANLKNARYHELLGERGVEVFEDAVESLRRWRREGLRTAMVSSSRNARAILERAGLAELFDVKVDGTDGAARSLPGKPAPDYFLDAAARLGVAPEQSMVLEDATSGVEAGRRGGFGLVVGVARDGTRSGLLAAGADRVVGRLSELGQRPLTAMREARPGRDVPLAGARLGEVDAALGDAPPIVLLDYDGTLTPIVEDPDAAVLSGPMRERLARLSERCVVAVVSGRDLADVRRRVDLPGITYAGSHGFDVAGPGLRFEHERGERALPDLDAAEQQLRAWLAAIPGVRFERKRFSLAVHYRQTPPERHEDVRRVVEAALEAHPSLRRIAGKMVHDLQPDVAWDKGCAVRFVLDRLPASSRRGVPVYVGDDVTDEDAFRELGSEGLTIVVGAPTRTLARYRLEDVEAVARFLEHLERRFRSA